MSAGESGRRGDARARRDEWRRRARGRRVSYKEAGRAQRHAWAVARARGVSPGALHTLTALFNLTTAYSRRVDQFSRFEVAQELYGLGLAGEVSASQAKRTGEWINELGVAGVIELPDGVGEKRRGREFFTVVIPEAPATDELCRAGAFLDGGEGPSNGTTRSDEGSRRAPLRTEKGPATNREGPPRGPLAEKNTEKKTEKNPTRPPRQSQRAPTDSARRGDFDTLSDPDAPPAPWNPTVTLNGLDQARRALPSNRPRGVYR